MASNKNHWETEFVKISEILNTEQVRRETVTKEIKDLQRSLDEEGGLLQPIGLCNSDVLDEHPDKKYHLIWGQRRLFAAKKLGWEEIEARVWNMDEKLSAADIRSKAISENEFRYDMSKGEVRKAVEQAYKDFGKNEAKTKKAIPLDNRVIDDALKDIKIDNIKGASEVVTHLEENTNIKSPDSYKWDIVDVCKTDESKIDKKKAIELVETLAKYDAPMIKKILKKADAFRKESVDTWEKEAKYADDEVDKRITFLESELKLLEAFIEENQLGDINKYVHDITMSSFDPEDVEEILED
jgi:ParB/RepB/Spo0J family partition protein